VRITSGGNGRRERTKVNPTVSAHHAVLLRTGDSYSLKDLNSTSGTQVNGDFVTDAELKDGDTIRFGSVMAVFAGAYRKPCSSHGIRKFWMSERGTARKQPMSLPNNCGSVSLQWSPDDAPLAPN